MGASARCPRLSQLGRAGSALRNQRRKRRWWKQRKRPGPGAGRWALWLPCILVQERGPGPRHQLRGLRCDPPPHRKRMVCLLEGPGLKGAGGPRARIAPSVENLSARRITSKCTFECTQVNAPTSVRTATTRAHSLARSSTTCNATTGSSGAGQGRGHPQSRPPLPSGLLEPRQPLSSLRLGWSALRARVRGPHPAALHLGQGQGRGPVGSLPAPGGPCATGEAVRPNPWTCPCGRDREERPGQGVPSTDASSVPLPRAPRSSWPCTCKCTTVAGPEVAACPRPTPLPPPPCPSPVCRRGNLLPVLRRKERRVQGCRGRERPGWGAKSGREPFEGCLA